MKLWLRCFARLYPAAWRARYGREFEALLDDLRPSWRDLWDIIYGAFLMQLSTPAAYWKLGAVTAVLGAILATGWSFTLPRRYVSTVVMRMDPQPTDSAFHQLSSIQQEVLSRRSLSELIQRPGLDLYRDERKGHPLEDIIQGMRSRDIRIQALTTFPGRDSIAFRIEFAHSDPAKAQAVAAALADKFTSAPGLEVLDRANLPTSAVSPNPLRIAIFGLAAGFALGLTIAFFRRLFRDRAWARAPYFRYALACGALLAIVSGFASYAIADRYVSTAVLRLYPPDPARLNQLQQEVFSRSNLARIIQRPQLDLYRRQRQHDPLEDIVEQMRRDISVHSAGGPLPAFTVQFEYPDRFKSQAVVRELVTSFIQANFAHPGGKMVLEVLDPASLPAAPAFPNRLTFVALGLAAGIPIGLLIAFIRRSPPSDPSLPARMSASPV